MSVIVVIPTYNEAVNLPRLVPAVLATDAEIRVLVVDDDSPDGTGRIADDLAREAGGRVLVLHRERKGGMGRAYVEGFQRALEEGATHVVQMDADFAHDPSHLPRMLELVEEADVVIGSRYCAGADVSGLSAPRRLLSRMANLYARLILGIRCRDVTGGFKCYRREVLLAVDPSKIRSTGFAFQVEVLYKCILRGFRMVETPIVFKDRTAGRSKMSLAIMLEGLLLVPRMKRLARAELEASGGRR